MHRRAAVGSLALALALAPLAAAHVVDRAQVTLGRLVDASPRVVVARVDAVDAAAVRLTVLATLSGPAGPAALVLPRASDPCCDAPAWAAGARVGLFLDPAPGGGLAPLATPWHAVALADDAAAAAFTAAVEALRPRLLLGREALAAADGPRAARFALLGSPLARAREDAALDLLGWAGLEAPSDAERAALAAAVDREGAPAEVLLLAARCPDPALVPALLRAARGADALARAAAGRALVACAGAEGVERLAADLAAADDATAVRAAETLAATGDAAAARALGRALGDARPAVRAAAARGLARAEGPAAAVAVEALAAVAARAPGEVPGGAGDVRRAVAGLARLGAGAALARLAADDPRPDVRALAARLRADPLEADALLAQD